MIGVVAIGVLATSGCTKRNPDYCCTSRDACKADGFDSLQTCAAGVCINNACVNDGCSVNADCGGEAPYCSENVCVACTEDAHCSAAAPVCDAASHACRLCAADNECASGACDLAVGTCVDVGAIRYAAPGGTAADPCTATAPCSFARAAQAIDAEHTYVVLRPGKYTGYFPFDGAHATVVGSNATLSNGSISSRNKSKITIRHLSIEVNGSIDRASLSVIEDSQLTAEDVHAVSQAASDGFLRTDDASMAIVRRSTFRSSALTVSGHLIIDASVFDHADIYANSATALLNVTNSVIIDSKLSLFADLDNITGHSTISFNTLIGGSVSCNANSHLYFNIIQNSIIASAPSDCVFENNLASSVSVIGPANIAGDPMFADEALGNFHLRPGSPAIDKAAATPDAAINHDFDFTPRPQGATNDIGAFEYVPMP